MKKGIIKDANGKSVIELKSNGEMFIKGEYIVGDVTRLILNNEEIIEYLNEGVILDAYSNDNQIVFQVQLPIDIDLEKSLMIKIVDKISELAFNNKLKIDVAHTYSTYHEYYIGYELKFSINN